MDRYDLSIVEKTFLGFGVRVLGDVICDCDGKIEYRGRAHHREADKEVSCGEVDLLECDLWW